jgi:hypothetical protein
MKRYRLLIITLSIIYFGSSVTIQCQNWKKEISSYYFYVKCLKTDKYWDLKGHHPETAQKGNQFQIHDMDDDKYERSFTFPKIEGTEFFAIRNLAGYIVDVKGKDELNLKEKLQQKTGKKFQMKKDDGAEIQTWEVGSKGVSPWQQWRMIVVDKNTVEFENVFTHKAIDVAGGSSRTDYNNAKLVSMQRTNSLSQQFQLIYADGPNKGQPLNFEK